ncbi:ribonuclease H-like protein [Schizopora paradoxa]|uniref:ribonuclease H n=1 Tax=Schizopora paradoxa TaxID=27342 RepID=A0A0H2R172_9AGAM|nr:ribonuclease H-like protein [Schizopora paradoxa]
MDFPGILNGTETWLDQLVQDALKCRQTEDEQLIALYGPVYCDTAPVHVYTDGSCHNNGMSDATAASATYWGPDCRKNWADRVPGEQSNNRAELYAILQALKAAEPDKTLNLYSDSEYALKTIAYWAARHYLVAWDCTHGDIIKDIVLLIQYRHAPLSLFWVKAHARNKHNIMVDFMANQAHLEQFLEMLYL